MSVFGLFDAFRALLFMSESANGKHREYKKGGKKTR